jgi:hypothetical protein
MVEEAATAFAEVGATEIAVPEHGIAADMAISSVIARSHHQPRWL